MKTAGRNAKRLAAATAVVALLGGMSCARRGPDRAVDSLDGVTIVYHIEGQGSPTLVFVHGWNCDRSFWRDQVAYFAQTHTVVAIDLPGHGESGTARKDWAIQAFGADVAAVVKAEGLKRVLLVGHSMGGEVSLEAARLLSGRAIGIIGVDTFQDFAAVLSPEEIASAMTYYRANFKASMEMIARSMFPWGVDPNLVDRVVRGMMNANPGISLAVMEALFGYRPDRALREVRLPIRVINSDRRPTNIAGNRKMAASFGARIMTGRGHFLFMETPGEFNHVLEQTIADLDPGR
jgi:pimeloyl-ACP methyl ester carboxylesterase